MALSTEEQLELDFLEEVLKGMDTFMAELEAATLEYAAAVSDVVAEGSRELNRLEDTFTQIEREVHQEIVAVETEKLRKRLSHDKKSD